MTREAIENDTPAAVAESALDAQATRALVQPLYAGKELRTGESFAAHADGIAAIVSTLRPDPDLLVAAQLFGVYDVLREPDDWLRSRFGSAIAQLIADLRQLMRLSELTRAREAARGRENPADQTDGQIMFSSDKAEINQMVGKTTEACYGCHAEGKPLEKLDTPGRARIFKSNGHRVLGMITPIYNEPDCSTAQCHAHSPEQKVLGVFDITLSLENTDKTMEKIRRTSILFAGITILVVSFVIILIPPAGVQSGQRAREGNDQCGCGQF